MSVSSKPLEIFRLIFYVSFLVDHFRELLPAQGNPISNRGRGLTQALGDFLAGEAVACMEPKRLFLHLSQSDVWILGPELLSETFVLIVGECRELNWRGRYVRHFVGEDFT